MMRSPSPREYLLPMAMGLISGMAVTSFFLINAQWRQTGNAVIQAEQSCQRIDKMMLRKYGYDWPQDCRTLSPL